MVGDPAPLPALDNLLERASTKHSLEITTSTLAITEVAFFAFERQQGLNPMAASTFDTFWNDPLIRLVPVSIAIARAARHLVCDSLVTGPRLKPPDAIHLATAQRLGVTYLHSYDRTLHRYSGRLGFPISTPRTPTTNGSD
jgi:predicted nucleic acid-binding protein